MPRIEILADVDGYDREVIMTERIAPDALESDHFGSQLLQRVGWALADAEAIERELIHVGEPRQRG